MGIMFQGVPIDGLIFDLDGTLLDSMPNWQSQLHGFLLQHGIEPPADLLDRTKTLGLENATESLLAEFHISENAGKVYQGFQKNMEALYFSTIPLKPGVMEYLNAMRPQCSMSVATATAHDIAGKVLAHHRLTDYFQSVTTCAEVGIGKHDPKIYITAARKMGLEPSSCMVLEDSLEGVLSAKRAGFCTVAVYEETNPVERERLRQEANCFIHDFRELL